MGSPDGMFPDKLKDQMFAFNIALRKLFKRKKVKHNLSRHHCNLLSYLCSQQDFIIAQCDKNLGPAIIERDRYIQLAYRDHFSDTTRYKRLSKYEADLYTQTN